MDNAEQQRHEQEVRAYLTRRHQSLQHDWDKLSELLTRLQKAYAIETDVLIRFKQEKQLEGLEAERAQIERKLQEIEADCRPACLFTQVSAPAA